MSDNHIKLVWRDNRKPGEPEWSADCGCAFHYTAVEGGLKIAVAPHWHLCELHAGAAALKKQVAKGDKLLVAEAEMVLALETEIRQVERLRTSAQAEADRLRRALETIASSPEGPIKNGGPRESCQGCWAKIKQAKAALAPVAACEQAAG